MAILSTGNPNDLSVAGRSCSQPATGIHAELLVEITETARKLLRLVELEQSGVRDGEGFWIGYDPILTTAQRLVALAEQRDVSGSPS